MDCKTGGVGVLRTPIVVIHLHYFPMKVGLPMRLISLVLLQLIEHKFLLGTLMLWSKFILAPKTQTVFSSYLLFRHRQSLDGELNC